MTMFEKPVKNDGVKRCPECKVPFAPHSFGVIPNVVTFMLPDCYCRDKQIKAEKEKEERSIVMSRYKALVEKSNLPLRCIDQSYEIPLQSIYDEQGDDVLVHLEYEKFHRFINNPDAILSVWSGIFMPGNPGTRKTTYACELAKRVMMMGKSVKYFQCAEIVTKKVLIYENIHTDFLILDDLGNNSIEKRDDLLWTLVNKRIDAKKFTIIITNFSDSHNREMHGDAFMDRLKLFMPLVMIGESSRVLKE